VISVLIATRDRCQSLEQTLGAFCQLEDPPGGWHLVVVDNGSRDATTAVLEGFSERLPLAVIHESRPGKNVALNSALEDLSGDLVVFTDDDVTPEMNWLQAMRAAADGQTGATMIGGAIEASWEVSPPGWVMRSVPPSPAFSVTDSISEGPVNPRLIFGPNMAIRASVFEAGFRFAEHMGPRRGVYAQGGETELLIRLGNAGYTAWHTAGAVVRHRIRAEQIQVDWLLGRAFRFGRGEHRLEPLHSPESCGSPTRRCLAAALTLAAQCPKTLVAASVRGPAASLRERWQLYYCWGRLREGLAGVFGGRAH
jgi:glycosyltransferase involved in cell wall biosynthesis